MTKTERDRCCRADRFDCGVLFCLDDDVPDDLRVTDGVNDFGFISGQSVTHVVDVGIDRRGDFVLRYRGPNGNPHASLTDGDRSRGRTGDGVDRRIITCVNRYAARFDDFRITIASITDDVRIDVGTDPVKGKCTRTADGNTRLPGCHGDRAGQYNRVDFLLRMRIERQCAFGVDAGILDIGLDLHR